ncbi:uncharacterized protein METZ01_LOCUS183808 [marine metagenome]|uniref:Uncharacterized protein n=1 Tax=marine metagenome TaxID=408172 RepID=A0A382CYT4_9ZZZZ
MPEDTVKKTVDIDTSGPGAEVDVAEEKVKDESVVETEVTEQEPETKVEETETVKEIKKEQKKDDEQLEEYSKGVQSRISKLTRKMREAERQRDAATEYARAADESRKTLEKRFVRADSDYIKRFESSVKEGMDSAQKDLARAIESGDAKAQVEANKKIATLAFDNARLEQSKEIREEAPAKPADVREPQQPSSYPASDPQADAWAGRNTWFGQDRAMTFTAFEIHKDLVDKEGFDPKSDEYYAEVDKRIRVDFPHKFGTSDNKYSTTPVQTVASAKRSVKPGRKTVRLTSSQVAIAKKLGVPLEEYAKQLKNTKGVV